MRKKVFFRVFCFTALAVIATVVLITLAPVSYTHLTLPTIA